MSPDRDHDNDGRALWEQVTKSIRPLRQRPKQAADTPPPAPKVPGRPPVAVVPPVEDRPPTPPAPPPLAGMDRRTRQRVARGRVEIAARLDLHGMTLERARARLGRFLEDAQTRGASLVLVITGKGTRALPEGEAGALRRQVPLWLALPEFRPLVIGFEEAAPSHGGAGALYVRVRRRRDQRI